MGGFTGKLGTAVGYMWRGVWCMRAHNPFPSNPRTPKQVAHREMFKQEVQLAATMRWAINKSFKEVSYEMGMTPYNLFVHLNQHAFSLQEGVFTVDYSALCLCSGPLTEAAYEAPVWTADNVLTVNLAHSVGRWNDYVRLYIHCPETGQGILTAPVYRNAKKISTMLPTPFAGREVHVYGLVNNDEGMWAETTYVGRLLCSEVAEESDGCGVMGAEYGEGSVEFGVDRGEEIVDERTNQLSTEQPPNMSKDCRRR